MRIQHNISALNSYRQLGNNNNALSKNLEKLSSGYRINRAGDDAAGLAISEKMRAQIKGLEAATKNANDGISLVQTAEGALTEVHSMLNRMTYLATQSANGTYDNEVDRANLQKEVTSLLSEVDRISEATNYNGINLLDGSLGGGGSTTKAVNADLSKLGIDVTANAEDITAVKGQYKSSDLMGGNADITGLTDGDTFKFTMSFTDADGNTQNIEKTLIYNDQKVYLDDGSKDGLSLGTDGALATDDQITKEELSKAVIAALNKDDTFKANFTATQTTGEITFTAREGGKAGAVVDSVTSAVTKGGTPTTYATKVDVAKEAADATKAYDLSKAKIWNNDTASSAKPNAEDNLKDAIFEINGKKFVFTNDTLTEKDLAALRDAGVDHWVTIATPDNDIAAADVTKMAEKITKETGLVVETGTATTGAWTPGTGTKVVFKDSTLTDNKEGKGLKLQIGDTAEEFNQLTVSVGDMSAKALGIADVDISTQDGAAKAIEKVKTAINTVSSTRGDLGAVQNRLEHTINNLGVTSENMTAAESRIRDTDMAEEMMNYTKNNILIQAAQAMLAQANQVPQGVLQLLR